MELVDLAGKRTPLVTRPSIRGLAWTADGKEVWFASPVGIEAVPSAGGVTRVVHAVPGALSLEDLSSDGRALVIALQESTEMVAFKDGRMVPLSWLEASKPRALSADGALLAFSDSGGVYIRKTDGSGPPERLGDGEAIALSENSQRVLALLKNQYVVYGLDGMVSKTAASVARAGSALFHPDGKRLVFEGSAGSGNQLWIRDLDTPQARAISPAGGAMSGLAVSPDGKFAASTGPDGKVTLYPVEGGAARTVPDTIGSARLIQWSRDPKAIFVYDPYQLPARVERLDVSTGKRELVRELSPTDPSGIRYFDLVMSADASVVVLGLERRLGVLQVVRGLR